MEYRLMKEQPPEDGMFVGIVHCMSDSWADFSDCDNWICVPPEIADRVVECEQLAKEPEGDWEIWAIPDEPDWEWHWVLTPQDTNDKQTN